MVLLVILIELGCAKIVKNDEKSFLLNSDRWHSVSLWEKPISRNSLSVICMRVTGSKTYAESLPLWENNILMFENRNGVLWVHPLLHRKNNPEPVFVNVYGAQESIPRNPFSKAGNGFTGLLKTTTNSGSGRGEKGGEVLSLFIKFVIFGKVGSLACRGFKKINVMWMT